MTRCDEIQDRLLDHLYGLLDAADSRELLEHTEHCPACREAFAKAQAQRRLLAVAARRDFANLRFTPPTILHSRPAEQDLPRLRGVNWTTYALAAAILLAMAGLGWPEVSYWYQARKASLAETRYAQLEQQITRLDQVRKEAIAPRERAVAEARQELKSKLAEWQHQLAAVQQDLRQLKEQRERKLSEINETFAKRDLNLVVTGPAAPEAGAANHYDVQILDKANRPVAANVSAQVVDPKSQGVLYEQKGLRTRGSAQVKLPASLPLKPQTDLKLVVKAKDAAGTQGELQETLSLIAPVYLTHLATDKPMYRPGEVVHFRSLTLERFSLRPADADLDLVYSLATPSGETKEILRGSARPIDDRSGVSILGPDGKPVRGIGCGDYVIAPEAPAGEYTLIVREAGKLFPPQQRKFTVSRYEKPLLNKELQFAKKAYGPGDVVAAVCRVTRPTGEPLPDSRVSATVEIDGIHYGADGERSTTPIEGRTDQDGAVQIRFSLPRLERGQAQLTVTFHDSAVVESIVRPIPLTLKKLNVEFFPEGGRLVAGVPNRVYFQATTTLDMPAELKGRIVDDRGRMVVSHLETVNDFDQPGVNQGMGSFTFTPDAGRQYELAIDSPVGIEGRHELPGVDADGVVLSIPDGVTKDGAPLRVKLWSGQRDRSLVVGAYCRGRLMADRRVDARKGRLEEVELQPEGDTGGVYRITVFEMVSGDASRLEPRAERLIYRIPPERLSIAIRPDRAAYSPGDRVKLQLQAHDERGVPAAAVLMLAVTDKSALKLADEKAFHTLPTHFLLMTEVRRPEDLEFADFLLSDHPRSSQALDLVLGTQGWRRFVEQGPRQLQNRAKEAVARLGGGDRFRAEDAAVLIDARSEERRQAKKGFDDRAQAMLARISELRRQVDSGGSFLEPASTRASDVHETTAHRPAGIAEMQAAAAPKSDFRELADRVAHAERELTIAKNDDPDAATRSRLLKEVKEASIEHWILRGQLQEAAEWVPDTKSAMLPLAALGVIVVGLVFLSLAWIRSGRGLSWARLVGWGLITCGLVTYVALNSRFGPGQARRPYGVPGTVAQVRLSRPPRRPRNLMGNAGKIREQALKAAAAASAQASARAATEPPAAGTADGGAKPTPVFAGALGRRASAPSSADPNLSAKKDAVRPQRLEPSAADADANRSRGQESENARQMQANKTMQPQALAASAPALAARAGANRDELDASSRKELARFKQSTSTEKWMNAGSGAGGGAARPETQNPSRAPGLQLEYWLQPPLVAREYAHLRTSGGKAAEDLAETLYWHPVFVLTDGKGEASFDLPDSATTFQILAAGHTLDGRLGAITIDLTSQPHSTESKPPSR